MRRGLFALRIGVVGLAAVLAFVPLPPSHVERYYADSFYPALQSQLTALSNFTALSLSDFVGAIVSMTLVIAWVRSIRAAVRTRSLAALVPGVARTATVLALMYLWFLFAWGLNYAREPLEVVTGYDASRVTPEAVRALTARALFEVNRTHAAGHAAGFPEPNAIPADLLASLHQVERRLGKPRPTTPGRPKRTALAAFFRASGTEGMHAPFLLETLLNPDLTPPERAAVLAHEWAHLAGYAPESHASFVGLIAALHAGPASQYSGWLALFHEALSQLPVAEQRALLARLDEGPRADRRAIFERLESRVDFIATASWQTYDQYLRSQGVREGVDNYSRVVQLLIGSGALEW